MEKLPLYELVLGGDEEIDGVNTISFVEHPAIEIEAMFFNKDEKVEYKFIENNEENIVIGPSMVPNQEIYRVDSRGNEYNVFFTEETIKKCNELFFKRNQHQGTNYNHSHEIIEGAVCIESWISMDKAIDKSVVLGYDLPIGTWYTAWKIDDVELWSKIKEGGGFSIEGMFIEELVKMSEESPTDEDELYDNIAKVLDDNSLSDDDKYDKIEDLLK